MRLQDGKAIRGVANLMIDAGVACQIHPYLALDRVSSLLSLDEFDVLLVRLNIYYRRHEIMFHVPRAQ